MIDWLSSYLLMTFICLFHSSLPWLIDFPSHLLMTHLPVSFLLTLTDWFTCLPVYYLDLPVWFLTLIDWFFFLPVDDLFTCVIPPYLEWFIFLPTCGWLLFTCVIPPYLEWLIFVPTCCLPWFTCFIHLYLFPLQTSSQKSAGIISLTIIRAVTRLQLRSHTCQLQHL